MMGNGLDIVFSSSKNNQTRLQKLFEVLKSKRNDNSPRWRIASYDYLVFYDYTRPFIKQERVIVTQESTKRSFTPKLPQGYHSGEYCVVLEWSGLMVPQNALLVNKRISPEIIHNLFSLNRTSYNEPIPKYRISKQRYIQAQISTEEPLVFTKPSTEHVIETLFETSGFSPVERSSAAKYHTTFINRCGGLAQATHYLTTTPYRELLTILSDNSNKNKLGWVLDYPSKRRALHHLHIREILQNNTPSETKKYFDTVSDELPIEAFNLLEKGLLERGFLLSCTSCSYKSWYPAERVGQTFECTRCFQSRVYNSNPLWLYKLPEVIFQGFEDNMQVPLLALNYLKQGSQHSFEWVPDSNVYRLTGDDKSYRNLDILCIVDGKFYIGEAKSNDKIEAEQFSFYEEVCQRVAIDGIVFATSQPAWNKGTQQRIDSLKTWYKGEVRVLTEKELYPNIDSINQ